MIKSRIIFPGIIAYSNFFQDPMEIFKKVEDDGGWFPTQTGGPEEEARVIEEKRKGLMHVVRNKKKEKDLNVFATQALKEYKNIYGVYLKTMEPWYLLKYNVGDFFMAHTDDSHKYPRNVSFVYYGNDDYVGGEIEFIYFNNLKIKPKAGELILFPSNYMYVHQANKIISGKKYSAVSFAY